MTTAIFDAGYLARRAYFSTRRGRAFENSMAFGFFRDVAGAMEFLQADTAAFCFDSPGSCRRRVAPGYKISRADRYKKMSPEEQKDERNFHAESARLPRLLRTIGYRNIYKQDEYEADDLIASCCGHFPGRLILVSSDQDLWQLLSDRISCWNPAQKKITSLRSFRRDYEIEPGDWVTVKSMAGCSSDDIAGITGVGEKTAARFIRGALRRDSAIYAKIRESKRLIDDNRLLVRLPFPGTMICSPQPDDRPTADGWIAASNKIEIPTVREFARAALKHRGI